MKFGKIPVIKYSALVIIFGFWGKCALGQSDNLKLWYKQPAEKWTDALPVGNGCLGAMIFGGVDEDHVQFNEQTRKRLHILNNYIHNR